MQAYDKTGFDQQMQQHFMPVDLDFPGLRVQHLDPPVFTVEGFFTPEQCEELVAAALETGGCFGAVGFRALLQEGVKRIEKWGHTPLGAKEQCEELVAAALETGGWFYG